MKKIHGKNPALTRAYAKKLTLNDGHRIRRFTADDLVKHLSVSKQHAYRLIKEPNRLQTAHRELLLLKTCGSIPSWGSGWYIEENGLRGPNGFLYSLEDMENYSMARQLIRLAHADNQKLQETVELLNNRIEWLQKRLATPGSLHGRYEQPRVIQWKSK